MHRNNTDLIIIFYIYYMVHSDFDLETFLGKLTKSKLTEKEIRISFTKLINTKLAEQLKEIKAVGDSVEGKGFLMNTSEHMYYLSSVALRIGMYIKEKLYLLEQKI